MESQNTDATKSSCCNSCCENHYPRIPNTHLMLAYVNCCIGCDKPGMRSMEHNPANNSCSDFACFCCPCALIADTICYIPMCFGFYNITYP